MERKLLIVPNEGIEIPKKIKPIQFLGAISIFSMIIPLIIIDISTSLYQAVFFTIFDIPKIKRSDYLVFDRNELKKLSWFQRISCIYCEYANGIMPWATQVTKQTETYTCAIKHKKAPLGQEHQSSFRERSAFE